MKILITGSNGLLGQKLVGLLSEIDQVQVIATARGENRLPSSDGYQFKSLDITNRSEVDGIINEEYPDVIIHGAALSQVDYCEKNKAECWLTNVTATGYLVKAAEMVNAHFIFISTDFVFDGSFGPLDEKAKPNPINYYGKSKLAAERNVENNKLKTTIVRTVLVYGVTHDSSRSNIVLWVKGNLERGSAIKVVDDQWRTPTLAEDLAMGCWLIAKHKSQGTFHISGEGMVTPYEMAMKIADFFELDSSLITPVKASIFTEVAERPLKTGLIIDKAKTELGYEPHSFEEGLKKFASQLS